MAKKKVSLAERLKRKKEKLKSKGGGYDILFVKEGTMRVRPLYAGEEEDFAFEVIQFYLGKDMGGVISPASMDKPCALMEEYQRLKKSKKAADKDLAKKLIPKTKFLMPVVVYEDSKGKKVDSDNSGKMVLLTKGMYETIIDYFLDEEWGDMTHPTEGYDLKLKREGTTLTDTEYSVSPCQKPTKTPKPYHKQINLDKMVEAILPSYEDTQEKLAGFLNSAVPDDDLGEEAPKKKLKKKSKTGKKGSKTGKKKSKK